MSEPHDPPTVAGESAPVEPEKPEEPRSRRIAIGRGGAGLLAAASAVAVVATAPFWAPLMPWSPAPAQTDTAPADRPDRAEATPPETRLPDRQPAAEGQPQSQPETAAVNPALQLLDRRVAALEARPTAPASDVAETRQLLARLASGAADLNARVGALEARPVAPASAIAELRQLLATLTGNAADLDARVEAIGKAVSAAATVDTTDMALVLALLQIRGALEVGRPFAPEYDALAALARARPAIAAAAAPLAEPAKTGLATRAVLAGRLRELAGAIATAKAPATTPENAPGNAGDGAAADWVDQALMHLRGLVTIRRIDGAGPETAIPETKVPETAAPEAAVPGTVVKAAALALAGGDLEGAAAALGKLTGAPEAAARPWLRMARERLAAEAALQRIEALLVARLGSPATAAPATAPAGAGSAR